MMQKLLFFILPFVLAANVLRAQGVPTIKLSQIEQSKTVDTTKAGQIGVTNSAGVQRYAQYVKINPTPIAYTPTATGNPSTDYSSFVEDPAGDEWYIDYRGRGLQLTGGGATCDVDWLQISDNSCPNAITDSIYKYKYVSIGGRYVWPTAELLVNDSSAVGTQVISGFRNARFVLYDNLNQHYSTQDQGGLSTIGYYEPGSEMVWKTASGGTPAAPGGTLVNHVRFNFADSTVQWYRYPNTRDDAATPVNFLSTTSTGVMQSNPLSEIITVTGAILQNGNSFGAPIMIGSNDNQLLELETNGVIRALWTSGASTGGAFTTTDVTANTNVATENSITITTNSSGTPAAGFGARQLYQLETTTTNSVDANAITSTWTTATHASRTSALLFSGVNNAGALGEMGRFSAGTAPTFSIASAMGTAGTTTYANAGISPGVTYTIGGTSSRVLITSTGSGLAPVLIDGGATSTALVCAQIGSQSGANTTGQRSALTMSAGFSPSSGTGTANSIYCNELINQTGGANGAFRDLFIAPTLTAAADYRAIEIDPTGGSGWALYATDANFKNAFAGNTIIGASTTPAQTLHVAGTARITGSSGTPTLMLGRNGSGDLADITVGSGLSLLAGTLSATGGGGITGSGAANQVTIWSGTSTVTADTGFVYDPSTKALSVNNSFAVGGAKLTVNGRLQTIGGIGVFQGTGLVQSSSNAAGIRLVNPTASTGDTWSMESANGGNWNLYNGGSGTPRATVDATGQLGLGIATPTAKLHTVQSVAATTSVTDNCIFSVNSTGTPGIGFGTGMAFYGESSTTDNQFMGSFATSWSVASHANRTSDFGVYGVLNGSPAQLFIAHSASSPYVTLGSGSTQYLNAGITAGTSYTIGNSSSALTLSSSLNSASAITMTCSDNTATATGGFNIGNSFAFTGATSGTRNYFSNTVGTTYSSGSAVMNLEAFTGTINNTGTTGIGRTIYINNTITAHPDYRCIEITSNNANAKGIYQTGSSTTNSFVGKTGFGSTTAPTDAVDVTGNLNLTTAGNKIKIATGSNASVGTSGAMTAGTITISTTAVTSSSKIFLVHATVAGTQGILSVGTITNGTSFVINSSNAADTGTVNWWIIN